MWMLHRLPASSFALAMDHTAAKPSAIAIVPGCDRIGLTGQNRVKSAYLLDLVRALEEVHQHTLPNPFSDTS